MGFYIRKSFKLGPIRFNLSKSGVGVSAGVKGARAGIDARGKKYIHVGRGGIYYRQTLEDGADESAAPGSGIGWGAILIIFAAGLLLYGILN
jgi:hypothetical protein